MLHTMSETLFCSQLLVGLGNCSACRVCSLIAGMLVLLLTQATIKICPICHLYQPANIQPIYGGADYRGMIHKTLMAQRDGGDLLWLVRRSRRLRPQVSFVLCTCTVRERHQQNVLFNAMKSTAKNINNNPQHSFHINTAAMQHHGRKC